MDKYQKLSLFVILDAYVTKNAIEDFLENESYLVNDIASKETETFRTKVSDYIKYLKEELRDIENFLDDSENIHWLVINQNRKYFDKNLPKYKRKIKLFHSVDRYPFDYNVFLNE